MMALRALLRSRAAVRLFATETSQSRYPSPQELGEDEVPPAPIEPETSEDLEKNVLPLDPLPERTYGTFSDQLSSVAKELQRNLSTVLPGKASSHMFNYLKVYHMGDFVNFSIAANTTKVASDEVKVHVLDYYMSPMVELALKNCGIKLDVKRDFDIISVKVLEYNKEAAIKKVDEFAQQAKEKVREIFAKQQARAQTYNLDLNPQAEQLHLQMLEETVSEKKSTL